MTRLLPGLLLAALIPAWAGSAYAQTPTMGTPPGGTLGAEEPKQEGNAEKAPTDVGQLPTLPPLPPYPNQERKKFELIELGGYMRLRTEWLDNFHLGFHDLGSGVPFEEPVTCRSTTPDTTANRVASAACSGTIGSADMRVRLEPVINVSENVSVHMQIDLLDNLVLGSTPDGIFFDGTASAGTPSAIFSNGQAPVAGGVNSPWDSVRVKQAWGDVKTPLGDLRFGRMPNQWGMGIYANAGGYDWIHGTTCTDCNFGDTVDRVIFGAGIPGTNLRAAIGMTWASSSPTQGQLALWKDRYLGQPYDADNADDVTQWDLMMTRIDDPAVWKQAFDEGHFAANYGFYLMYRSQDFDVKTLTLGSAAPEVNYVTRHATAYIPDVWGRLAYKQFLLEGEFVAMIGSLDNLNNTPSSNAATPLPTQDIRMFGGAARASYAMLNQDLNLSLEVGFASGDQWESPTSGVININDANYFPQDGTHTTISAFHFNRDYRVDMILWRELYGAVINATYVKPTLSYNITERFKATASGIVSFANVPVSTPGNSELYGIELNGDIGYSNPGEGFFAGLSYGVLFPFGALGHPSSLFPTELQQDASTAQTFQMRLVIKF